MILPQLLGLFCAHMKELNFSHEPILVHAAIMNAIGFSMVRIQIYLLVYMYMYVQKCLRSIKCQSRYTDREILGEIIKIRGELLTVNFLLMMDNRGIIYL